MPNLFSYQRYQFSANLWHDEAPGEPGGLVFLRLIVLDVSQDEYGRIVCRMGNQESDVKAADQLHSLRNREGVELYPGGVWVLESYEPELNIFDHREGFRGRANLAYEASSVE